MVHPYYKYVVLRSRPYTDFDSRERITTFVRGITRQYAYSLTLTGSSPHDGRCCPPSACPCGAICRARIHSIRVYGIQCTVRFLLFAAVGRPGIKVFPTRQVRKNTIASDSSLRMYFWPEMILGTGIGGKSNSLAWSLKHARYTIIR